MSASLPPHHYPSAYLLQEQITFVTDNERDAEALSCETDYPVVIKRPENTIVEPFSERPNVSTLQTSETSGRSNVPNGSDASDIMNVSDVSGDSNVSDAPPVENFPDAPDVSDIPYIQTSDL